MKTNVYESAVLINAALEDEQIEAIVTRIKDTIINNGGTIREVENWGRKRLAYMVKKSKIGYYAIFRFDAPPALISKLERFYTLDDNVLRFLSIILDEDAIEHLEKHKNSSIIENDNLLVKEPLMDVEDQIIEEITEIVEDSKDSE